MASPIDLFEHGFMLACEKHEKTHKAWRSLHRKLEKLRDNDIPYDAGDHDGRIDCLLREMEDDQLQYISETGEKGGRPTSRTKLQIQLTRYWIGSSYEMLRTTAEAMGKDHKFWKIVDEHKLMFAAYRIPIAKQEPHRVKKPSLIQEHVSSEESAVVTVGGEPVSVEVPYAGQSTYRVKPMLDADTGSIVFLVYDGKTEQLEDKPRRVLSDTLLEMNEVLPDLES